MKTLKKFEFPTTTSAAVSKYDWDKLFDGGIYQMEQGTDFTSDPLNFTTIARNQAQVMHKNLQIHRSKAEEGKPVIVTLQATPMTDEQAAEADAKVEARKATEKARRAKAKEATPATETPAEAPVS